MRGQLVFAAALAVAVCIGAGAAAVGGQGSCLLVLSPVEAGAVPDSKDFAPVPCPAMATTRAFRYDRVQRFTRVARDLARDDIVRAYPEFGRDVVRPGQALTLVVTSGLARVEVQVQALQSAEPGERLFVRRNDGEVLATRYAGGSP